MGSHKVCLGFAFKLPQEWLDKFDDGNDGLHDFAIRFGFDRFYHTDLFVKEIVSGVADDEINEFVNIGKIERMEVELNNKFYVIKKQLNLKTTPVFQLKLLTEYC